MATDVGEESNERIIPGANDWEPAKIMIKPREQLQLTDKELQEEFTKILRADNPEAPTSSRRRTSMTSDTQWTRQDLRRTAPGLAPHQ